jgi:hypothetical protein
MTEPKGPTEFGHGRGLRPPRSAGYEPTELDLHLAVMRTDTTDPNDTAEQHFADWEREK